MKHAGARSLEVLNDLLHLLRLLPGLRETKTGVFYRRSKAFLHFHEDPAGLFADAQLHGVDFERMPVNTRREREALLHAVGHALGDGHGVSTSGAPRI